MWSMSSNTDNICLSPRSWVGFSANRHDWGEGREKRQGSCALRVSFDGHPPYRGLYLHRFPPGLPQGGAPYGGGGECYHSYVNGLRP